MTSLQQSKQGDPVSLAAALAAGKKVRPDVTGLLAEDHRTVMGWFAWYAAEPILAQKIAVLGNILRALKAHMTAEEEVFYPEAARCIADAALIEHAVEEHEHARGIMAKLERELADPTDSLVNQLRDEIEMHAKEEETRLFPKVRESDMDLHEVGAAVAARREAVLFETLELRARAMGRPG